MNELKSGIERLFEAALFSMDYPILQIIIHTAKRVKNAYGQQDYFFTQYLVNKSFWDTGVYIKKKLERYVCIDSDFFKNITANIERYLSIDRNIAFTPENLQRCLKLVELAEETWFESVAYRSSWSYFAKALDQSDSFEALKTCFSLLSKNFPCEQV